MPPCLLEQLNARAYTMPPVTLSPARCRKLTMNRSYAMIDALYDRGFLQYRVSQSKWSKAGYKRNMDAERRNNHRCGWRVFAHCRLARANRCDAGLAAHNGQQLQA